MLGEGFINMDAVVEQLSYEEIIEKQRKEKKELLARTQKMKHAIPKGDKKKKKEVSIEIAQMLANLDIKHEEQVKEFQDSKSTDSPLDNCEESQQVDFYAQQNGSCSTNYNSQTKISKAQKRRSRKAEIAKNRENAIAEQETLNLTGNRQLELVEITRKLSERGLSIHEIPSDGNCLYNAISHQLSSLKLEEMSVQQLRTCTSDFLLSHQEEYIPFITNPNAEDDLLTEDQYIHYCEDIKNTNVWGGQVEIQALFHVCGKPIEVIQAEGPSMIAGDENIQPKLIISYHRFAYGLGEHYNSVVPS